jgi:hypothetical protein
MAAISGGSQRHGGAYRDFPDGPEAYRKAGADGTLQRLFQAAVAHAEYRIAWYDKKANEKGKTARRLRWLALLLFALGTLAPIMLTLLYKLAAAFGNANASPPHLLDSIARLPLAEIGFVSLGIAGALVIFDQFFDTSGSWIRFRQAQARLEVLLADLRFGWAALLAQSGGTLTDRGAGAACIALLREFIVKVEQLAETETKEWAERFRSRIDAFDRNPNLKIRLDSLERRDQAGAEAGVSASATTNGRQEGGRPAAGSGETTQARTVEVRVAVEGAAGIDPGSLRVTMDGAELTVPDDRVLSLSVEIDVAHRLVATAVREGREVRGELELTPTAADEGKSLVLELNG